MSHFLSTEEIKNIGNELQSSVVEFLAVSKQVEKEQNELEQEMMAALEAQRVQNIMKELL